MTRVERRVVRSLFVTATIAAATAVGQPSRIDELMQRAIALAPNVVRGKRTYLEACGRCHGSDAWGRDANAVPALAGQNFAYLVLEIASFIEAERDDADMHRALAASQLTRPQTIADIAGYLADLPFNPAPTRGDGARIAQGKTLYEERCADCHGVRADGAVNRIIPNLRGQHYSYLLLQLRRVATGHRFGASVELMQFFDSLSGQDMEALADYISRLDTFDEA